MNFVVLDFETYWDSRQYTLSKMGPTEYIRDPRFEAQLLAIVKNFGESVNVYGSPEMIALAVRGLEGNVLIGHNLAGFDALVLSERYGLHPQHMWDTIAMMNWTGVSRVIRKTHEALTEFFGNGVKKEGTVVSNGKHWPDDFTDQEQSFFERYCLDDALQCAANAQAMIPYMTQDALQFMSITARMATEPVFVLDEALLEDYIAEIDSSVAKARSDIMSSFRFPNETAFLQAVRSAPRFAAMLTSLGVTPPMKVSEAKTKSKRDQLEYFYNQAQTPEAKEQVRQRMETELPVKTYAFSKQDLDFLALRDHPDPRVQLLVETRLEHNSSINRSRAERFLTFARHHKPVPIMLSAFNAHTSRYTAGSADESASSDRLQFQNLSKRDPAKAKLRQAIKAPDGYKVVACDSSQVEARCLAWVANELELVAQFREGRDPYSELAEIIFGVPADEIKYGAKHGDKRLKTYRNVGKTAILSAGYGVGAQKFSDTLLRSGAALSDDIEKHNELAFHAHAVYRAAHPNIMRFWRTCSAVIDALLQGYSGKFGGPNNALFEYGMMSVCGMMEVPSIKLPSGFIIRYPNLQCEQIEGKNVYRYDTIKGKSTVRTKLYSGALCNNINQGFAFQILMWQACRMDSAGVPLAANIHDSFAAVVPAKYADETAQLMLKWMSTVPPWATGLPVAAEAEIGDSFEVV